VEEREIPCLHESEVVVVSIFDKEQQEGGGRKENKRKILYQHKDQIYIYKIYANKILVS
jgi:hypothetical protein